MESVCLSIAVWSGVPPRLQTFSFASGFWNFYCFCATFWKYPRSRSFFRPDAVYPLSSYVVLLRCFSPASPTRNPRVSLLRRAFSPPLRAVCPESFQINPTLGAAPTSTTASDPKHFRHRSSLAFLPLYWAADPRAAADEDPPTHALSSYFFNPPPIQREAFFLGVEAVPWGVH